MKKWTFVLAMVIMAVFCLEGIGHEDHGDNNKQLEYIRTYRYVKEKNKKEEDFLEYKILFRTAVKMYLDFTALGAQHFSRDTLLYAEWLLKRTSFLNVFLMVCDRIVRNIAFDPRLYDIDIRSGKANDHFASRVIK